MAPRIITSTDTLHTCLGYPEPKPRPVQTPVELSATQLEKPCPSLLIGQLDIFLGLAAYLDDWRDIKTLSETCKLLESWAPEAFSIHRRLNLSQYGYTSITLEEKALSWARPPPRPSPIAWATQYGHMRLLKMVLHCWPINGEAYYPEFLLDRLTPLTRATVNGHQEMIEYLIQHGASVNDRNSFSENALAETVFFKIPDFWRNCTKKHDINPLYYAIRHVDNDVMAKFLLQRGASLSVIDSAGVTALHVAALWGRPSFIRYLVEHHGMNIDVRDEQQRTPLHWACSSNHMDDDRGSRNILQLTRLGADVNAVDNDGYTPLITLAVSDTSRKTSAPVHILLSMGADPNPEIPPRMRTLWQVETLMQAFNRRWKQNIRFVIPMLPYETTPDPMTLDTMSTRSVLAAMFIPRVRGPPRPPWMRKNQLETYKAKRTLRRIVAQHGADNENIVAYMVGVVDDHWDFRERRYYQLEAFRRLGVKLPDDVVARHFDFEADGWDFDTLRWMLRNFEFTGNRERLIARLLTWKRVTHLGRYGGRRECNIDRFRTIKFVIKNLGVDVHWRDPEGRTFLHLLGLNDENSLKRWESLEQIFLDLGADPNALDNEGRPPALWVYQGDFLPNAEVQRLARLRVEQVEAQELAEAQAQAQAEE